MYSNKAICRDEKQADTSKELEPCFKLARPSSSRPGHPTRINSLRCCSCRIGKRHISVICDDQTGKRDTSVLAFCNDNERNQKRGNPSHTVHKAGILGKTSERVGKERRRKDCRYPERRRFDFPRGISERMASRPVVQQQNRGVEGVVAGAIKQKNVTAEGRNCRVLGDIGNMVTLRGAEGKQQLPQESCHLTRGFCAQLLANAQATAADKNKKCIGAVNVDGFAAANGETAPASSWPTLPNRSLVCRPLLVDIGRCTCVIVKETSPDGFNRGTLYSLYTYGPKLQGSPWHDLHCRIDGPAAYDVLINFAQRWRSNNQEFTSIPEDDPKLYVNENDQSKDGMFRVDYFRFCEGFSRKELTLLRNRNLICGKAYIQAIRSAQNFIYIENQYFLGSSYAWPSYEDAGADHLIPMELAMKVVSKIRANERFAIYVVMPMWPEGDPKTATMQEILFWQSQTMHMMYQVIAQEIKSMQLDEHPSDNLNFYCLGNREDVPSSVSQSISGKDNVSESLKFQRFMIYVHAKGMIVDDEYVIVGSANINQRSMAGSKDTEIAMGAYQPHHTWARKLRRPHGQIYGYRMSLWEEHLGKVEGCFEEPNTLECVRRVNEIAQDNWKKFIDGSFTVPLQVKESALTLKNRRRKRTASAERQQLKIHLERLQLSLLEARSLLCRPLHVDIVRCTCVIVKETSPDGFNGGTLYSLYTYISKQYELDSRDRGRPDLKIQSSVKNFQLTMELNDEFLISQEN
nr:phospholipase D delta-like [Ipomoea batatas]